LREQLQEACRDRDLALERVHRGREGHPGRLEPVGQANGR
jgi:hypothetical protein